MFTEIKYRCCNPIKYSKKLVFNYCNSCKKITYNPSAKIESFEDLIDNISELTQIDIPIEYTNITSQETLVYLIERNIESDFHPVFHSKLSNITNNSAPIDYILFLVSKLLSNTTNTSLENTLNDLITNLLAPTNENNKLEIIKMLFPSGATQNQYKNICIMLYGVDFCLEYCNTKKLIDVFNNDSNKLFKNKDITKYKDINLIPQNNLSNFYFTVSIGILYQNTGINELAQNTNSIILKLKEARNYVSLLISKKIIVQLLTTVFTLGLLIIPFLEIIPFTVALSIIPLLTVIGYGLVPMKVLNCISNKYPKVNAKDIIEPLVTTTSIYQTNWIVSNSLYFRDSAKPTKYFISIENISN